MVSAYNRVMCAESASIQLAVHLQHERLSGSDLKLLYASLLGKNA